MLNAPWQSWLTIVDLAFLMYKLNDLELDHLRQLYGFWGPPPFFGERILKFVKKIA